MKPMTVSLEKTFKKKNFMEKKSKWPPKKNSFSSSANFHFFEIFFPGMVLGLVGLINAKDIDVAQPIWS